MVIIIRQLSCSFGTWPVSFWYLNCALGGSHHRNRGHPLRVGLFFSYSTIILSVLSYLFFASFRGASVGHSASLALTNSDRSPPKQVWQRFLHNRHATHPDFTRNTYSALFIPPSFFSLSPSACSLNISRSLFPYSYISHTNSEFLLPLTYTLNSLTPFLLWLFNTFSDALFERKNSVCSDFSLACPICLNR